MVLTMPMTFTSSPIGPMPTTIKPWTDGPPFDRIELLLSAADRETTLTANDDDAVTVTDLLTGERFSIRRADCGLGCRCAATAEWVRYTNTEPLRSDTMTENTKRVVITTRALATVDEEWTFGVPSDWTDEQIAEAFEDGEFGGMTYIAVENVEVDNEQDREIQSIEVAPAPEPVTTPAIALDVIADAANDACDALTHSSDILGPNLTCAEAGAVADLLRVLSRDADADAFIRAHAGGDDEETDQHHGMYLAIVNHDETEGDGALIRVKGGMGYHPDDPGYPSASEVDR